MQRGSHKGLQQLQLSCPRDGLRAALGGEFAKDVAEVLFDGAQGNDKRARNFPIGMTGGNQL